MAAEPQSVAWHLMERALLNVAPDAVQRADLASTAASIEDALARLGVPWTADHLDGAAMLFMAAGSVANAEHLTAEEAFGRVGIWLVQNQDRLRAATTS